MASSDYLIVETGLLGSLSAHQAREGGRFSFVIDRRDAVGDYHHYCYQPLAYNSLKCNQLPSIPDSQGFIVAGHNSTNRPFTQIIKHNHCKLTNHHVHTIISRDFSDTFELGRQPFYPVNDSANAAIYAPQSMVAAVTRVQFSGHCARPFDLIWTKRHRL